jgi:ribosome recycling factor
MMIASPEAKKVFDEMQKGMLKAVESTRKEFKNIRTGRASIALVEGIQVDYYNTPTPLKSLANISTPDAKTIAITPWDPGGLPEIERALLKSDLGLTPVNDGKLIRISIPSLTQERREELSKVIKKTAEEGRVSVRAARHAAIDGIKKLEKTKVISEDDSHAIQKDIQKFTDKFIAEVDEALKHKEAEIHSI